MTALGSKSGLRGKQPETNRLHHDTTSLKIKRQSFHDIEYHEQSL
jgi:hypothetical protein